MERKLNRRNFARTAALAGIGSAVVPFSIKGNSGIPQEKYVANRLKISLNAYSFNNPLMAGTMKIPGLLEFCALKGFDAVDLTGYYFPGYPAVPSDEYIYSVKKKAFRLGLGISGTGVRNDFTFADPSRREAEKKLVREWVLVAEKLGAPIVRIFAGNQPLNGKSWDEVASWVATGIKECAEFGKQHGVMMALQNHNDFLKTSSDVNKMMGLINHEWTGLLLDIGSYHSPDPYREVAETAKHAISWQLKEKVFVKDTQVDTDYKKILDIVRECGYAGYLPLETLGEGNPETKVEALLKKVQKEI